MELGMLQELCISEMGEAPTEIELWYKEEGFAEYLVRFENMMAVITVSVYDVEEEEIGYMLEQTMYINASEYLQGSALTQSINSEQVLLKVDDKEIYLTNSGGEVQDILDILDTWAGELCSGEVEKAVEDARSRVASLRRERQAIISKLEHLDMGLLSEQIGTLKEQFIHTRTLLADGVAEDDDSL